MFCCGLIIVYYSCLFQYFFIDLAIIIFTLVDLDLMPQHYLMYTCTCTSVETPDTYRC